MARIPYVDGADAPADLVARISAGRRGGLINVYRLLLHAPRSPPPGSSISTRCAGRPACRAACASCVIIRIAMLNRTDYVLGQHVPKLAAADGVSAAECEALRDWRKAAPRSAKRSARRSPMRTP